MSINEIIAKTTEQTHYMAIRFEELEAELRALSSTIDFEELENKIERGRTLEDVIDHNDVNGIDNDKYFDKLGEICDELEDAEDTLDNILELLSVLNDELDAMPKIYDDLKDELDEYVDNIQRFKINAGIA